MAHAEARRTQILLTRRRGARGDLYISQFSQRENAIKSLSQFVRVGRIHGSLTQVGVFTSRRNAISWKFPF